MDTENRAASLSEAADSAESRRGRRHLTGLGRLHYSVPLLRVRPAIRSTPTTTVQSRPEDQDEARHCCCFVDSPLTTATPRSGSGSRHCSAAVGLHQSLSMSTTSSAPSSFSASSSSIGDTSAASTLRSDHSTPTDGADPRAPASAPLRPLLDTTVSSAPSVDQPQGMSHVLEVDDATALQRTRAQLLKQVQEDESRRQYAINVYHISARNIAGIGSGSSGSVVVHSGRGGESLYRVDLKDVSGLGHGVSGHVVVSEVSEPAAPLPLPAPALELDAGLQKLSALGSLYQAIEAFCQDQREPKKWLLYTQLVDLFTAWFTGQLAITSELVDSARDWRNELSDLGRNAFQLLAGALVTGLTHGAALIVLPVIIGLAGSAWDKLVGDRLTEAKLSATRADLAAFTGLSLDDFASLAKLLALSAAKTYRQQAERCATLTDVRTLASGCFRTFCFVIAAGRLTEGKQLKMRHKMEWEHKLKWGMPGALVADTYAYSVMTRSQLTYLNDGADHCGTIYWDKAAILDYGLRTFETREEALRCIPKQEEQRPTGGVPQEVAWKEIQERAGPAVPAPVPGVLRMVQTLNTMGQQLSDVRARLLKAEQRQQQQAEALARCEQLVLQQLQLAQLVGELQQRCTALETWKLAAVSELQRLSRPHVEGAPAAKPDS